MIKTINITPTNATILLTTDIVYGYRTEFCNAQYIPLKLSLMKPRTYFHFDKEYIPPTILFVCGGGWSDTDHNVWMPELCWFAKKGYAIASIQYPVTTTTRFPEHLDAINTAIHFLCEHSRKLKINMENLTLMGESAGAYLALLCAATNGSSTIDSVVAFYPPVGPMQLINPQTGICSIELPNGAERFPSLLDSIQKDMPPTLILHGTSDEIVPTDHGKDIYQKLQNLDIPSDLFLIEGANHADSHFFQPLIKEQILEFIINHQSIPNH